MRLWLSAVFCLVVAAGFQPAAFAHDGQMSEIRIENPWARATARMAKSGAVYLAIANHGAAVDRLVGVATPAARRAALHSISTENDMVTMRPVAAIEIHPGTPTVLRPGGIHIMLMRLKAPLIQGATFPLTLTFEKAGAIEVRVEVKAPGAMHHDPAGGAGNHFGSES